jgi:acylphosphatase
MGQAEQVRAHVYVSGLVQGVYFRHFTREQARKLGVQGWVRNLHDERVEAVFEGPRAAIDQIINWCRQGPPAARVEGVAVTWETPTGQERGFDARY